MVLAGFAGFLDSLWLLHQLISLPCFHPPCLSSSSSRECLPAAVPGGAQGAAGHGVAAPRACGAATWAGSRPGPPRQPREPQGRR